MTLYNHITIAQKLFLTCSYRLNDITIFRATNAAKPSGITTYRSAITQTQLSCIVTLYHYTILLLKLC